MNAAHVTEHMCETADSDTGDSNECKHNVFRFKKHNYLINIIMSFFDRSHKFNVNS